jgi:ABC-type lipoprotein release transport system permease subunit
MIFRIALRNVLRQKRRSLLTALTMAGGFALASVSIAWQDGAYNDIIDQFTRTRLGHIQIHETSYRDRPKLERTIAGADEVGRALEAQPRVRGWAPRVLAAGLAAVGEKSAGVSVMGIDPEREHAATDFDNRVVEGAPLAREAGRYQALLGRGVARRLRAAVGDELVILSQGADGSLANDLYTIAGIVESGDNATDQSAVWLHIADAQELFVLPDRAHEIVVVADGLKGLFRLADDIAVALDRPDLAVEPWQVFAKSFYEAMKTDQEGNWIGIFIIMIVVAVGVLNTVLMSVLERTREYGLLRAMGTRPRHVFALVLAETTLLAVMSVAVGAVIALGVNYWLTIHGVSLPEELSFQGVEFKDMYAEINVRSFVIPAVVVMLAATIVSTFPALRAARTAPAAAMRSV